MPGPGTTFADRLLGLAGGGVFPAGDVAAAAVRSYRTISPLPEPRKAIGRVFSVALSLGLPPVAVSHHRALILLGLSSGCWRNQRPPEPPLEFAIYCLRLTICREPRLFYRIRRLFAIAKSSLYYMPIARGLFAGPGGAFRSLWSLGFKRT